MEPPGTPPPQPIDTISLVPFISTVPSVASEKNTFRSVGSTYNEPDRAADGRLSDCASTCYTNQSAARVHSKHLSASRKSQQNFLRSSITIGHDHKPKTPRIILRAHPNLERSIKEKEFRKGKRIINAEGKNNEAPYGQSPKTECALREPKKSSWGTIEQAQSLIDQTAAGTSTTLKQPKKGYEKRCVRRTVSTTVHQRPTINLKHEDESPPPQKDLFKLTVAEKVDHRLSQKNPVDPAFYTTPAGVRPPPRVRKSRSPGPNNYDMISYPVPQPIRRSVSAKELSGYAGCGQPITGYPRFLYSDNPDQRRERYLREKGGSTGDWFGNQHPIEEPKTDVKILSSSSDAHLRKKSPSQYVVSLDNTVAYPQPANDKVENPQPGEGAPNDRSASVDDQSPERRHESVEPDPTQVPSSSSRRYAFSPKPRQTARYVYLGDGEREFGPHEGRRSTLLGESPLRKSQLFPAPDPSEMIAAWHPTRNSSTFAPHLLISSKLKPAAGTVKKKGRSSTPATPAHSYVPFRQTKQSHELADTTVTRSPLGKEPRVVNQLKCTFSPYGGCLY